MDVTKQDTVSLRHIVLSLNTLSALNTELENERLKLAEAELKRRLRHEYSRQN